MAGETVFRDPNGSAFPDTAFEPQSDFMFDEPGNEDEFRTMQRNIASLNVISEHNARHDFQQMLEDDGANSQLHQLQQPNFVQPMFFNGQADMSPNSSAWAKGQSPLDFQSQSAQAHLTNGRASVSQHYGQITPPDEYSTGDYPVSPRARADQGANSKSERARNAANQRHAKAKKARKDSVRSKGESPVDDEVYETGDKREKYREKNRLAAAKCRAKKKTHTEDLEDSARHITATNNRLRAEERELRDLFSSLRHQALAHDPTQGCTCTAIHTYNHHKAQEAARGAAMSLGAMGAPPPVPSPSMTSDGSAMPSPGAFDAMAASRAHSFSSSRPSMPSRHQTRTQSLAGQVGFVPPRADMVHHTATSNALSPDGSGEDIADFAQNF